MSFDQVLNQLVGTQQGGQKQHSQPLSGLMKGSVPGGLLGGLAAGGLLGAVIGNKKMRKTATKYAGGIAGLGGAALLGVVAHKAYRNWQDGQPSGNAAQTPHDFDRDADMAKFDPETIRSKDGQPFQLALLKAMIAASLADGTIDSAEYARIFEAVDKMALEPQEKAIFLDLLKNPPAMEEVAALADGLEQASELYLASRMAIDPDLPSERAYLSELAKRMAMPVALVTQLENQVADTIDKAA